jgi:hypothetical protein
MSSLQEGKNNAAFLYISAQPLILTRRLSYLISLRRSVFSRVRLHSVIKIIVYNKSQSLEQPY